MTSVMVALTAMSLTAGTSGSAGAAGGTDYLAVALGGIAGGLLALVSAGGTWLLNERGQRGRESRADARALRDARAESLRVAYTTVILSVRALVEVITHETVPDVLRGGAGPEEVRKLVNEMGGAATRDIRAAELALWLGGEETELVQRAVSAYGMFQLSLALPGVLPPDEANKQIGLLNESLEALRTHARKRLCELRKPL